MKKGFTLIELLVIITIIAFMSVFVIPNLRFGEKQFAVQNSAHKLTQDLRRVQEMAMSSSEFNGIIPKGGYGIYFEKKANFYTLFADCSSDKQYDSIGTQCNGASEKILEQSFLDEKVFISNLKSPSPMSELNIVFTPPDPTIYIEPGNGSIANIFISYRPYEIPGKTIIVNKAGLIFIKDRE